MRKFWVAKGSSQVHVGEGIRIKFIIECKTEIAAKRYADIMNAADEVARKELGLL